MNRTNRVLTMAGLAAALGLGLAACEKKGTMEEAGEKVDKAVDDAKDSAKEAEKKIDEALGN